MKRRTVFSMFAVLAVSTAGAQTFDLGWNTIDGGGGMWSVGATLELSGTVGQPDAGVVMTGGTFELIGGFWPGVLVFPPGDMNCDGVINGQDIDGFILVLLATDAPIYANYYAWSGIVNPPCNAYLGDMNGDGAVNGQDIDGFVAALLGL